MQERILELEHLITKLEHRIARLENKQPRTNSTKMRIARVKEMIEMAGGAVLFSEVRTEIGIGKNHFSQFIHTFLEDPDYVIVTDRTDKRKKYIAKRGYAVNGIEKPIPGYVYLLRANNGLYKIGLSIDPDKRLSTLKCGSPDNVLLIHTIKTDSPHEAEKALHKKFNIKRVRAEWFALDEADVKFIRSLERLSGDALRLIA